MGRDDRLKKYSVCATCRGAGRIISVDTDDGTLTAPWFDDWDAVAAELAVQGLMVVPMDEMVTVKDCKCRGDNRE